MPADLAAVYAAFARYLETDEDFCGYCYTPEEEARLRSQHPRDLDTYHARTLLHETADHWASSASYRRYLPRILQAHAPPESEEPLYPEHFPDTLAALGFATWPEGEQRAVLDFLHRITPLPCFSPEDRAEWDVALQRTCAPSEPPHSP